MLAALLILICASAREYPFLFAVSSRFRITEKAIPFCLYGSNTVGPMLILPFGSSAMLNQPERAFVLRSKYFTIPSVI